MELAFALNLLFAYSIPFAILAFWPGWRSHIVASVLAICLLVYVNYDITRVDEDNDGPGHALALALFLMVWPSAVAGIAAGTVRLSGIALRWWAFAALYAAFPLWAALAFLR